MTEQTVKLTTPGGDFNYPLLPGSVGPDVIDIRKLYGQTGEFTYDPGFTSTAACQSAITYIDGDQGILLHRGYPIDQLAEESSFMEVSYLLLHGDLPVQVLAERLAVFGGGRQVRKNIEHTEKDAAGAGLGPKWCRAGPARICACAACRAPHLAATARRCRCS